MEQERKYFTGKLNADDAEFAVGQDEYVNAENVRFGTTDAGATKIVESVGSTLGIINNYLPAGTNICIGSVEDRSGGREIHFNWNSGGDHAIYAYDITNNTVYKVLLNSQVTGGLNFDKHHLIHSCKVIDGLLYWTDNYNQPRRINIDAGINMNHVGFNTVTAYTSPLTAESITLIRKPPILPLTVEKTNDPAVVVNNIARNGFHFSYRYHYRDGEKSVPATYSLLVPYNTKIQNTPSGEYNQLIVVVPIQEKIAQDVDRVEVMVKVNGSNTFFTVKTWDKNVASESTEIDNHNAGTTALTYNFYNDVLGIAESESYSVKPFDSVPLYSETLELFDNRLGLGNNVMGYTTPTKTSINATLISETDGATLSGSWVSVVYNSGATTHYYLDLGLQGFFDTVALQPPPGPFPASIAYSALTLVAGGAGSFIFYLMSLPGWSGSYAYTGDVSTVTGGPVTVTLDGVRAYKSGSTRKLGVVFYDFAGRKCGYISTDDTLSIPDRSYSGATYVTGISWTLDNLHANQEIPSWATHYAVVSTKCLSTRFFMQFRPVNTGEVFGTTVATNSLSYVFKDGDGNYVHNSHKTYSAGLAGVEIDATHLSNQGMGYVFAEGDMVKVHKNGDSNVYNLRIIGQDGRWIICELQDLGTLSDSSSLNVETLVEIYTPYTRQSNEPFYEVGQMYPVTNPGTPTPTYSVTTGIIKGDVTLLKRGASTYTYLTENMSPDDAVYKNWLTDHGRPNFYDKLGQQTEKDSIAYSNTIIHGTQTNGLSTFDALDKKQLPSECGAIKKLQITSKVQKELGIVMLAICENETASLYISESQQYGSNASTTLAVSTDIIGTINILKGSYGTVNPESVVEFRGNVFWYDAKNGKVIQYGAGGLYPISNYSMTRFWKQFSDQYMSMSTSAIEALGNRPYVFATVDTHHNELLISIPKLLSTPPKGYLPDYPSTIYPFDIWDGQGKTIVYKISANQAESENNRWQGVYTFTAENFVTLQNKLFSFKNGNLYRHNQTNDFCKFYDVRCKPRIMGLSNMAPTKPKTYKNHSLQANMRPSFTYLYVDPTIWAGDQYNQHQQATDLISTDYNAREGQLYSLVYRNKLVPTVDGFSTNGLMSGEEMRALVLKFMLEFDVTDKPLQFKFTSFGFITSSGHTT